MGNAKQKPDESFMDELSPGTELLQGQFKIVEFLNSGGFGITYLATDSLERKVVIKECFPSSFCNRSRAIVQARSRAHTNELKSVVQLFVQEARSLAKLDHPNIVGVHQVFEDNQTAYMVLDFVEGRDLLDTLEDKNHGLTAAQIKGILKDVLGAIQFIHSKDILHRDISPDNILLDADMRPVLIDFGAAREEATKKSRVLSAMRVVKDGYSPQEFYVQGSEQTPSSDLYALAATFYHLIEGNIPPNSQARLAAIASGEQDPYEPLAGRIKGFDTKFLAAIDKALGILPKDRLQSAEDWLNMMNGNRRNSRLITQPVPPSSAAAATRESESRSKLVPLLGSAAVIAILAVGGVLTVGNMDATEELGLLGSSSEAVPVANADTPDVAPAAAFMVQEEAFGSLTAGAVEAKPEIAEGDEATVLVATESPDMAVVAAEGEADAILADSPKAVPADWAQIVFAEQQEIAETSAAVSAIPAINTPEPDQVLTGSEVFFGPEVLSNVEDMSVEKEKEAPVIADVAAPAAKDTPAPTVNPVAEDIVFAEIGEQPSAATQEVVVAEVAAEPATDSVSNVVDISLSAQTTPTVEGTAQGDAEETMVTFDTALVVELPFEGQAGSNVITKAGDISPIWVRKGTQILAINGVAVDSIPEISQLVEAMADPTDLISKELQFTIQAEGDEAVQDHTWTVPLKHQTALPNGVVFEAISQNGTWVTRVTKAPGGQNGLEVGDTVIAFMATSEKLVDQTTLPTILEREMAKGTEQFNFAVMREGSIWVVSMNQTGGA